MGGLVSPRETQTPGQRVIVTSDSYEEILQQLPDPFAFAAVKA